MSFLPNHDCYFFLQLRLKSFHQQDVYTFLRLSDLLGSSEPNTGCLWSYSGGLLRHVQGHTKAALLSSGTREVRPAAAVLYVMTWARPASPTMSVPRRNPLNLFSLPPTPSKQARQASNQHAFKTCCWGILWEASLLPFKCRIHGDFKI